MPLGRRAAHGMPPSLLLRSTGEGDGETRLSRPGSRRLDPQVEVVARKGEGEHLAAAPPPRALRQPLTILVDVDDRPPAVPPGYRPGGGPLELAPQPSAQLQKPQCTGR